MKIDISLRKQNSNAETEPVYLRFNDYNSKLFKGNKRLWYKTNYTVKTGSNIKKLPIQVRHTLDKHIIDIENDFNNRADFTPTIQWFKSICNECLNTDKRKGFLLKDFMVDHIDKKIKEGKAINTIKGIKGNASVINQFKDDIELADCNYPLFEKLINWMQFEKQYRISALNRTIRFLRTVLKEARKLHPLEVSTDFRDLEPLQETKKQKNIEANTYKVTFTDAELDSINKLELTNDYLINARKWLNIGVHTALRGADLLSLELEDFDFDNRVIKWQQSKVGSYAIIPIVPPLLELTKDYPRKISLTNLNVYLKELCQLGGMIQIVKSQNKVMLEGIGMRTQTIEAPKYTFCSSHMFRRSFVTKYYGKVKDEDIMRVTGHTSEKEFKKYIQETESNNDIWFKLYENGL